MNAMTQAKTEAPAAARKPAVPSFAPVQSSFPGQLAHIDSHRKRPLVSQPPLIQAKLAIGQPDDEYEREADRVAETVMRMPEPTVQEKTGWPFKNGPSCGDEEERLQMKALSYRETATAGDAPQIVHDMLHSPGQALDAGTRAFMEPRFGHDFSQVRVHADTKAADSARAVNALAYTVGRDIVFGAGRYAPGTAKGRRLIAHELTHVIQQSDIGLSSSRLEAGSPTGSLQQEAGGAFRSSMGNLGAALKAGDSRGRTGRNTGSGGLSDTALQAPRADHNPCFSALPLAISRVRLFGAPRLARAEYSVGALTIQIDYGNIIYVPESDYETEIETRFAGWSGSPANTIHAALTALTNDQKKWVLYGLDLLVDNTTPAQASFDRVQGIQRLITQAPSATTQPLSGGLSDFANEVLRVSGWFEVALSSRLTAPTGTSLTTITQLYNPPPGPSAPPGGVLDVARLNADIPPALTALLTAKDPASWTSVGTQSIGTIQTIGDQIQSEARTFFAPYADAAMSNVYSRGWVYSANISSVTTAAPTQAQRIGYLLNRAEIVGRQSRPGGAIFDNCNYDSGRAADRTALLSIATTMEADPVVRPMVDRLLQHTGRTSYPPGGIQVGISTEFNLGTMTECEARWRSIGTLAHELVHAMVNPKFPASASSVRFGQIIREGFTEVLGDQLYERIRTRANGDAGFKAQMEAGIAGAPCPVPAAATTGYGQAGASAETIHGLVGGDNFRAAYFLGAVNLVGL